MCRSTIIAIFEVEMLTMSAISYPGVEEFTEIPFDFLQCADNRLELIS
jgi:hypothetical protein